MVKTILMQEQSYMAYSYINSGTFEPQDMYKVMSFS